MKQIAAGHPKRVTLIIRWWWTLTRPQLRSMALLSTALSALAAPAIAQTPPPPTTEPTGGTVTGGTATITNGTGQTPDTVIAQSSGRAAIDWKTFSVGSQATVTFNQPNASSITLNQVTTANPSLIAGHIDANGQIAIVNQSGVVFFKGSQVDAAGLLVSAAAISAANVTSFVNGTGTTLSFSQAPNAGAKITNDGAITISGAGLASLVAPQVANAGVITATLGRVILGGALTYTLDLNGDGLTALNVTGQVTGASLGTGTAAPSTLVSNTGNISATGGQVVMTAAAVDGVLTNLVTAGGVVNAQSSGTGATGTTSQVLVQGVGGGVTIDGAILANGPTGSGTAGGQVQALAAPNVAGDAAVVNVGEDAEINAAGDGTGAGGQILLQGTSVNDAAPAGINANLTGVSAGATGGLAITATTGNIDVSDEYNPGLGQGSPGGGAACPTGDSCLNTTQLEGGFYEPTLTASAGSINLLYSNPNEFFNATNSLDLGTATLTLYTPGGGNINVDQGLGITAGSLAFDAGGSINLDTALGATTGFGLGPGSAATAPVVASGLIELDASAGFGFDAGDWTSTGGNLTVTAGIGPIAIGGSLNAAVGTISIASNDATDGGINEAPGGTLTGVLNAGLLAVSTASGDADLLNRSNAVDDLTTSDVAGGLSLVDVSNLTVTGPVTAGGNVNLTVLAIPGAVSSNLSLAGTLSGSDVSLQAAGGITQISGSVTAGGGALSLTALNGDAAIGGTLTSGDLANGVYSGTVAISTPNGNITQTVNGVASGAIRAGTLAASAGDAIDLVGTNVISTVGAAPLTDPLTAGVTTLTGMSASTFNTGDLALDDTAALTVADAVTDGDGPISINDGVSGTPVELALKADITGPGVALESSGSILQTAGTVDAGGVALSLTAADGGIGIGGTLTSLLGTNNGPRGGIALSATGGGITETVNGATTGVLTTVNLAASASNSIDLKNAANSFSALGPTVGTLAGVLSTIGDISIEDASPLVVSGDLTATKGGIGLQLSGAGDDLTFQDATVSAGTNAAFLAPGSITQSEQGSITADNALSLTAEGGDIAWTGTLKAGTAALSATGTATTGGDIIETGANTTITGALAVGTLAASASSTGEIDLQGSNTITTVGAANLTDPTTGTVAVLTGLSADSTNGITLEDNAALAVDGTVDASAGPVTIVDGPAGTAVALSLAAGVTGTSVDLYSTGGITQTAGNVDATGGNLSLDAEGGDIGIGGTLTTGIATGGIYSGSATLDASGNIAETPAAAPTGAVLAGTLYASSGGTVALGTPSDASVGNQIAVLGVSSSSGAFTLVDGQGLTVQGSEGPDLQATAATLVAPSLTIDGTIDLTGTGTSSLVANQFDIPGSVDAPTGEVTLDLLNAGTFNLGTPAVGTATVANLDDIVADTIVLGSANGTTANNPANFTPANGPWNASSAGDVTALVLNIGVGTSGTLGLFSDGTITGDAGIIAGELYGAAGFAPGTNTGTTGVASVSLLGTNAISALGPFALYGTGTGSFDLPDGAALAVNGPIGGGVNAPNVTIDVTGAVGTAPNTLTLDGDITGNDVALSAAGAISQASTSSLDAATLAASASDAIDLGGTNAIATIGTVGGLAGLTAGSSGSGGITLDDTEALAVDAAVADDFGGVVITDGVTGTPVALTLAADMTGAGVTLSSTGGISQTAGTVDALGGTLSLAAADGDIDIGGTLASIEGTNNGPVGTVALSASGNITETVNGATTGVIDTEILTGGGGLVALTTPSDASVGNQIASLQSFTAGTGFTLVDGEALTALVGNTVALQAPVITIVTPALTVDAGGTIELTSAAQATLVADQFTIDGSVTGPAGSVVALDLLHTGTFDVGGTGTIPSLAGITAPTIVLGSTNGTTATPTADFTPATGTWDATNAGDVTSLVLSSAVNVPGELGLFSDGTISSTTGITATELFGAAGLAPSTNTGTTGVADVSILGTNRIPVLGSFGLYGSGIATFELDDDRSLTLDGQITGSTNSPNIDIAVAGVTGTGPNTLTLTGDITGNNISLSTAGSVSGFSGAAIDQTSGNVTASGGTLSLRAADGDIDFAGTLTAGTLSGGVYSGATTLSADDGSVNGTGNLQTGTLAASASNAIDLDGTNVISTIGGTGLAAGGADGITLDDTVALAVNDSVIDAAGPVAIDDGVTGTPVGLTLAADVTGAGVTLSSTGGISQTSGVVDASGDALLLTAADGNIGFAGTLAGGNVTLSATGGGISENAATGALDAGTLSGFASDAIDLGGTNAISIIGGTGLVADGAGGITLDDVSGLTVNQAVTDTAGPVTIADGVTGSPVALTLAADVTGTGVTLSSSGGISQTSGTVSASGDALSLAAGDGDLDFAGMLTGGNVTLSATGGSISENAATGLLDAATLGAFASDAIDLGGTNAISTIGATGLTGLVADGAGGITLDDTAALTVDDAVTDTAGPVTIADGVTGTPVALTLAADVTGAGVALSSTGSISQTADTVDASGDALALAAAAGDIDFAGTLTGGTATLSATGGSISENATTGALDAGTLAGFASGAIDLGGSNAVSTIGATSIAGLTADGAAGITLDDTSALAIDDPVVDTAGPVTIADGVTGTPVALTLAANVTGAGVTLSSTGGISQTAGIASASGDALSLTAADGDIDFAGTLRGGTVTLSATGGSILENPTTGALDAGTLGAFASDAIDLDGTNAISTIGATGLTGVVADGAGGITLDDAAALTVADAVTDTAGPVVVADGLSGTPVALTLAADVTGAGVTLSSTGSISQTAGTVDASGDPLSLTAADGGIDFAGTLSGGTATLSAAGGGIAENATTGALDAGTLAAFASAAIDLGGTNAISTIGATSIAGLTADGAGGITLDDTSALAVDDAVTDTAGPVTIADGVAGTPVALTLAADVTGTGVTLSSSGGISQTSGTVNASGGALSLTAAAGDIDFAGTLRGGTATLSATGGGIAENATTGALDAGTLSGFATDAIQLGGTNAVSTIGGTGLVADGTGGITLDDTTALTVDDAVTDTVGPVTIADGVTGTPVVLTVAAGVTGTGITLSSSGGISQTAGTANASGDALALTAADGDIDFAGTLSGGTATLSATGGGISENAATGALNAGTLAGFASNAIDLGGTNAISTIGATGIAGLTANGAGGITLDDTVALAVDDAVTGAAGPVTIADGVTGTPVALTLAADVTGDGVTLSSSGGISQTAGVVSASGDALSLTAADGDIDFAGTLSGGTATLSATGGNIAENTATGVLDAGTLSGFASDAIQLGGTNAVAIIGGAGLTAGGTGGITLDDASALAVDDAVTDTAGPVAIADGVAGTPVGFTLAADVTGTGVTLSSSGGISQTAGVVSASGDALSLTAADGDIDFAGTLSGGTATLSATGGSISENTGTGALDAGTLAGFASGDIALGGNNAISTIGATGLTGLVADGAGGITLDDTSALAVDDAVTDTAGPVALTDGVAGNPVIFTLAADVTGAGVTLASSGGISQTAGTVSASGDALSLSAANGDIDFAGTLSGGTATLSSTGGSISENTASGALDAGTLGAFASDAIDLGGTNAISTIGGTGLVANGAGGITLDDTSALAVDDAVDATGGPVTFTDGVTGTPVALTLAANVTGTGVALSSTGGITQSSGTVEATANPLILTAADGDIDFAGTLTGGTAELSATGGNIAETGTLDTGTLQAFASGSIDLPSTSNAIATVGLTGVNADGNGGITINSDEPLAVDANVIDDNGDVNITDGPTGTPVTLSLAADITGTDVFLSSTGGIDQISGTVDSTVSPLLLTAVDGNITFAGTLTGGSTVLSATAGNITGTGVLQTGTLTAGAAGPIVLSNPANQIDATGPSGNFGGVTTPGDITIDDGAPLTVNGDLASTGGAIDVNLNGGANGLTLQNTTVTAATGATFDTDDNITETGGTITAGDTLNLYAPDTVALGGTLSAPNIVIGSPPTAGGTITQQVTWSMPAIMTGGNLPSRANVAKPLLPIVNGVATPGVFVSADNFTQTGTTTVTPLAGYSSATIQITLNPEPPLLVPPPHPFETIAFDTTGGLSAPHGQLLLSLGAYGSASGYINVAGLNVYYTGKGAAVPANLLGIVNGIGGQAAAGEAFVHAAPNTSYQINDCPIQSVDCLLLSPFLLPLDNPIDTVFVGTTRKRRKDEDLSLPDVAAVDY